MEILPGPAAGASAQAEYERRRARHRRQRARTTPIVVMLAISMAGVGWATADAYKPGAGRWAALLILSLVIRSSEASRRQLDSINAWRIGAEGERRTARALEPLTSEGYITIHDVPMPGSRANIDHIVMGPSGIFVVETKSFGGSVRLRAGVVTVNGRKRPGVIEQVERQVAAVEGMLPEAVRAQGIRPVPLVCVHRARLPLRPMVVRDVLILGPKGLPHAIRTPATPLSPEQVAQIASALPRRATRSRSAPGRRPASGRRSRSSASSARRRRSGR